MSEPRKPDDLTGPERGLTGFDQAPTGAAAADPGQDLRGPQLARAVLEAAQARRAVRRPSRRPAGDERDDGLDPAERDDSAADQARAVRRRRGGYTGPGPDPRDPQPFGVILQRLMKARGWQRPTAEATVFGAWERVVGAEVAAHCRPVKLEDGQLTVEAESTAWATQLRLLAPSLLRQIAATVGHNVVRKLYVHGPAAPSWSRGPRRVRGRGPRDTYG